MSLVTVVDGYGREFYLDSLDLKVLQAEYGYNVCTNIAISILNARGPIDSIVHSYALKGVVFAKVLLCLNCTC